MLLFVFMCVCLLYDLVEIMMVNGFVSNLGLIFVANLANKLLTDDNCSAYIADFLLFVFAD